MEGRFFTSTEAAEITQCSRRQLQYWREQGIIVPTVNTTGKGRNVYYSLTDLLVLTFMESLLAIGLSFELCHSALNFLRAMEPKFFERPLNDKTGSRFMLWQVAEDERLQCTEYDEETAIAAVRAGRAVIPIQIEALGKRLEKRLQLVGSPVELFSGQAGLGNGHSERERPQQQVRLTLS